LIIRILEKEPLCSFSCTEIKPRAKRNYEGRFREKNNEAAVAMLNGLARAHFYVKQVLLAPLART
jgi:hypothetical protein